MNKYTQRREDQQRLDRLMAAQPETPEQVVLKDQLIYDLRVKLGIIRTEDTSSIVHSGPVLVKNIR